MPISSAVRAASSATGRSDVPAAATTIVPLPGRDVLLAKRDERRIGVIRRAGHHGAHRVVRRLARARDQQRGAARDDLGGDRGDLGRRFA